MSIKDLIPWRSEREVPARQSVFPLLSLQQGFNRLFDDFWKEWEDGEQGMSALQPRVNVEEKENAFLVTAEVPGMDEKDIELELHRNTIILKGQKKEEHEGKEGGYIRRERRSGSFQRVITLPEEVAKDKAEARYHQGILTITLPKSVERRSRRKQIKITSD